MSNSPPVAARDQSHTCRSKKHDFIRLISHPHPLLHIFLLLRKSKIIVENQREFFSMSDQQAPAPFVNVG